MAYLLDADVLISAKNHHYRFGTFPCFWNWIEAKNAAGVVFSVEKVRDELNGAADSLSHWVSLRPGLFLPVDAAVAAQLRVVTAWAVANTRGYLPSAIPEFLSRADYFLVTHALARGFTVVTNEVPEPTRRKKIKIPDACLALGVPCMNAFQMMEDLGASFR